MPRGRRPVSHRARLRLTSHQCRRYLGRDHAGAQANGCCMARRQIRGDAERIANPPRCHRCGSRWHWVVCSRKRDRARETCTDSSCPVFGRRGFYPHSRYTADCINNPYRDRRMAELYGPL